MEGVELALAGELLDFTEWLDRRGLLIRHDPEVPLMKRPPDGMPLDDIVSEYVASRR